MAFAAAADKDDDESQAVDPTVNASQGRECEDWLEVMVELDDMAELGVLTAVNDEDLQNVRQTCILLCRCASGSKEGEVTMRAMDATTDTLVLAMAEHEQWNISTLGAAFTCRPYW